MADGAAGIGWNFEGGSRMTGVADVARFRAHRVVRGQRGGALGGRLVGFVIGIFLKGRGLILPCGAWYGGCEGR